MESESQHGIKVGECVGGSQLTQPRQTHKSSIVCEFALLRLLCLPSGVLCYLCQVLTVQGCTILPAYEV